MLLLRLSYVLGSLFIFFSMLIWPQETYQGAQYGLQLWATILVPSLLPFFIVAEIILNLGIVNALGVLLDPFMRPVFKLPGSASFVVVMGFTTGFPMGALLTKRLVEEKLCSIKEGERLVAFTNNSSALFILAAVAAGIFNNPLLGLILAIAHYLSNLLLGILLGLFSPRQNNVRSDSSHLLMKSFRTLLDAQKKRLSLGDLLGRAVQKGINSITLIGGFVVFFAVVIKLLKASSALYLLSSLLDSIMSACGLPPDFGLAFATGFWEMSLGIKELSYLPFNITQTAVAASIILAWSGISIQAQVVSVLAGSGISPHLYYLGRMIQGILAGLIAYLLAATTSLWSAYVSLPVFSAPLSNTRPLLQQFANNLVFLAEAFVIIFAVFISMVFSYYLFRGVKTILKIY